ncbi:MAG: AMIN domain-containing protein [Thermodesulfobacteriota bacterium]
MKKVPIVMILVLLMPAYGFCQEVIQGRYCYTHGETEGIQEARELTRTLAIRNAIESWKGLSEALGPSRDLRLAGDIIQVIGSGYLSDLRVVDHTEEGRTICETVEARISAEELSEVVRREVSRREREIAETGVDNNGCLKILRTARQPDRYGSRVMAVVKVLRPTGPLYLASQRESKPCFKVIVDSFDPEGLPLGSHALFVHESDTGMSPGETKALFFPLSREAKSFKAWLVGGIRDRDRTLARRTPAGKPPVKPAGPRVASPAPQQSQPGGRTLRDIVSSQSEGELTVRILADGPVDHYRKVFLESPSRLVIDLEGEWKFSGPSVTELHSGMVARIRTGRHEAMLRIVLDLKERERIGSAVVSPSPEGLTVILGRD